MSESHARILIVEDNEQNRQLVEEILRMHGFETGVARSGEEGVSIAGELLPDLILMDVQLPGIDGLEATRQLLAAPATAGIPVIAVTALAYPEDQQQALDAGCCDVVTKPFRMNRLLAAIEAALELAVDRA